MQSLTKKSILKKESGILLHISSLPNKEAIGTLGKEAHQFIDLLSRAGQSIWQILPTHPTFQHGSPFGGPSLFAGNPLLISLNSLVKVGDLSASRHQHYLTKWKHYQQNKGKTNQYLDYPFLYKFKLGQVLPQAYQTFLKSSRQRQQAYSHFCRQNQSWLNDYAMFMTLKYKYGSDNQWISWSSQDKHKLKGFDKKLNQGQISFHKYLQFVFDEQISSLANKAKKKNIKLIGDTPIYPAFDSADVWAHSDLFQLNQNPSSEEYKQMEWVAAVPPDYFSKKGQVWGNPLYKWGLIGSKKDHHNIYSWWLKRLKRELKYFNLVKLDHFRGFIAYGRISPQSRTAKSAQWIRGPGKEFFDYIKASIKNPPFILEDLGIITHKVISTRKQIGPGTKVFLFANFDRDPLTNYHDSYLPHNQHLDPNCVFYTGTHDNETLKQKIFGNMNPQQRKNILSYLAQSTQKQINWQAIDLISASEAARVIFPVQDIFFLGKEARMNQPSKPKGQWLWRMTQLEFHQLAGKTGKRLKTITKHHQRTNS